MGVQRNRGQLTVIHGDILMACVGATFGISYLHQSEKTMCYAGYLARYRARAEYIPEFISYWMESNHYWGQLRSNVIKTTIENFSASKYSNVWLPAAPKPDQRLIAEFLDRETGKIDALVEQQETLLKQLEEKRAATISHVVTKGLDPDVPMKDSGVEWLGRVPEHWKAMRVRHMAASMDYGISESLGHEGDVAVLRMSNLRRGRVKLDDLKYVAKVDAELLVRAGDILFNRTNSLDLVGQTGLVEEEPSAATTFASYLVRIRCHARHDVRFINYLLNHQDLLAFIRRQAFVAIGQANLSAGRYRDVALVVPQLEEQQTIADHLDLILTKLDTLATEARKNIALLRERRAALISAAVTGRIDVRGTAKPATKVGEAA
jgi:type I restriction enzyme S subunit